MLRCRLNWRAASRLKRAKECCWVEREGIGLNGLNGRNPVASSPLCPSFLLPFQPLLPFHVAETHRPPRSSVSSIRSTTVSSFHPSHPSASGSAASTTIMDPPFAPLPLSYLAKTQGSHLSSHFSSFHSSWTPCPLDFNFETPPGFRRRDRSIHAIRRGS